MQSIGNFILPAVMAGIVLYGLFKRINVFEVFLEGAKNGLETGIKILPSLIGLITAVTMFKASGALDVLLSAFEPLSKIISVPSEVLPLTILRPVSGGGALAIFENILQNYGPDSISGKIASVMMGSSETTFYCISLYYGSIGIKKTRHTIPAALLADFTSFAVSALLVLSQTS